MNVSAIPGYISPIVGYRVWHWDEAGLKSLNDEPWLPGRPLAARCRGSLRSVAHEANEAPQTACTCGVYAAKSFEDVIAYDEFLSRFRKTTHYMGCGVIGEVYLWGKVVEHDLGYRAQFAYPKSLALPADIALEPSRWEPLTVYGADISVAAGSSKDQHILLWAKGTCWCKQSHGRTVESGAYVTVLGRGIGLVERADGSSGCTSDSVCIRLPNNDLYIVPHRGIVWNCPNERWEVDLSGYMGTVILASSKGWKILCRP